MSDFLSRVYYNGTGALAIFAIPFSYILPGHITVYVNGVLKNRGTDYSFAPTDAQITFTTAPAAGASNVLIKRVTQGDAMLATIQRGTILPTDINTDDIQLLYLTQERKDDIAEAFATLGDLQTDVDTLLAGFSPNPLNNATAVTYTPPGTGATSTTVFEILKRSVSLYDFLTSTQKANAEAGIITEDITTRFNAANAEAGWGKTLIIPGGKGQRYLVTPGLNFNDGTNASFIHGDDGTPEIHFTGTAPFTNCVTFNAAGQGGATYYRGRMEDILFDAHGVSGQYIFSQIGGEKSMFRRLVFNNARKSALSVAAIGFAFVQDCLYEDCRWNNVGGTPILLQTISGTGSPESFLNELSIVRPSVHGIGRREINAVIIAYVDSTGIPSGSCKASNLYVERSVVDGLNTAGDVGSTDFALGSIPFTASGASGANAENWVFHDCQWENSSKDIGGGSACSGLNRPSFIRPLASRWGNVVPIADFSEFQTGVHFTQGSTMSRRLLVASLTNTSAIDVFAPDFLNLGDGATTQIFLATAEPYGQPTKAAAAFILMEPSGTHWVISALGSFPTGITFQKNSGGPVLQILNSTGGTITNVEVTLFQLKGNFNAS